MEAPVIEQTAPVDVQRTLAVRYLKSLALEALLNQEAPLRTLDIGAAIAERLGLQRSEEEVGALTALVRLVLDSDPIFAQTNRQWLLTATVDPASVDRRRPVDRASQDFAELLGRPVTPDELSQLLALHYGRMPDFYRPLLNQLAPNRQEFFESPGGRLSLSSWIVDVASENADDVVWDNFEDETALDELDARIDGVQRGADPRRHALAIMDRLEGPAPARELSFVVWREFPESDPQELFNILLESSDAEMIPGPAWISRKGRAALIDTIREMATDVEAAAEFLAATAPPPEEDSLIAPPAVEITDADLEQIAEFMLEELRPRRLADLCQQVLEVFPGSRTFPEVFEALRGRMLGDPRFIWAGAENFCLEGGIPEDVGRLPEGLAFDERVYVSEDGEEVDVLAAPELWKFKLEEQVADIRLMDVGDDDTDPSGQRPKSVAFSPALHHYVAGTCYVPFQHRELFQSEPDVLVVHAQPDNGEQMTLWFHHGLGLLYGLKEWYDAHLPWVGGVFRVEPTAEADEFRLSYKSEVDEALNVPMERLSELLLLRNEADQDGMTTLEIVTRILQEYEDGLPFSTLFCQLNVVRRVRREVLASTLTNQRYFLQEQQQAGIWRYDARRAQRTRRRGGKRPARRAFVEEEEAFLEDE